MVGSTITTTYPLAPPASADTNPLSRARGFVRRILGSREWAEPDIAQTMRFWRRSALRSRECPPHAPTFGPPLDGGPVHGLRRHDHARCGSGRESDERSPK